MSTPARGQRGANSLRGTGRGSATTTSRGRASTRGSSNTASGPKEHGRGALSRPAGSGSRGNQGLLQQLRSGQLRRGVSNVANKGTKGESNASRGTATNLSRGRGTSSSGVTQMTSAAPQAPSTMQSGSASSSDFMSSSSARLQQLKHDREIERQNAIQNGILADPNKKRSLEQAITPVGTCTDMCPAFERVERIVQLMADKAEKTREPASGRDIPAEPLMVKRFRRSAAGNDEQLPSDIRTPQTLKKTLDHLIDNVVGGAERLATIHKFVWDRTRAIRNDFSIQQVSGIEDVKLAVNCFERIARFHITALHQLSNPRNLLEDENFDAHQEREQLNNTLLSLMYYYEDNRHAVEFPNEGEFRAYCILLELQTQHPDLEDRMQSWPSDLLNDHRVQTAFELYSAASNTLFQQGPLRPMTPSSIAQADGGRFWIIITSKRVSYTVACVAEIYFAYVRFTQLDALWRSGKSAPAAQQAKLRDWTINELTNYLAFDDDDQTKDFCNAFDLSFAGDGEEEYLDFTALSATSLDKSSIPSRQIFSYNVVEEKRYRRTTPAVMNGFNVGEAIRQGLVEAAADGDDEEDEEEATQAGVEDDQSVFVPEQHKAFQDFSNTSFGSHLKPQATAFAPPTSSVKEPSHSSVFGKPPDATNSTALPGFGFGAGLQPGAQKTSIIGTKFGQYGPQQQTDVGLEQPAPSVPLSTAPSVFGRPFGTPTSVSAPLSGFGLPPSSKQAGSSTPTTYNPFATQPQATQPSTLLQHSEEFVAPSGDKTAAPVFETPAASSNPFARFASQAAPVSTPSSAFQSTPVNSPDGEHDRNFEAPTSQPFSFSKFTTSQTVQLPSFNFPPASSSALPPTSNFFPPPALTEPPSFAPFAFSDSPNQKTTKPAETVTPTFSFSTPTPLPSNLIASQTQTSAVPPFSPFTFQSSTKHAEALPSSELIGSVEVQFRKDSTFGSSLTFPSFQTPSPDVSGIGTEQLPFTALPSQTAQSTSPQKFFRPQVDSTQPDAARTSPQLISSTQRPAAEASEQPPAKVLRIPQDRNKLVEEASRLALLQPDGILEHLMDRYVYALVKKSFAIHKREERQKVIATLFSSILRRKYGHLWVRIYWRNKLNNKAEARRRLIAETTKAEEEKRQRSERELEEILLAAEETRRLQTEVKKAAEREAQPDRDREQQQGQQEKPSLGQKRKSMSDTHGDGRHAENPRKVLKAHSRSRTLGQSTDLAHRTSITSILGSSLSRRSVLGRSVATPVSTQKLDRTQTDYFRLKARGFEPDDVGHTKESLAEKERLEEDNRADFIQKSRVRPSMRSTSVPTPSPAIKPAVLSAVASSSLSVKPSRDAAVLEEDEFLKELRLAKEAMSEDLQWFKSQNAVLEKSLEQEELHRSQSSQDSPRVSINGLPVANGYEYMPMEVKPGHTMSRTEQRIRRTGAHGLATRTVDGTSSHTPVAMSRRSALRYSSGSYGNTARGEQSNNLDERFREQRLGPESDRDLNGDQGMPRSLPQARHSPHISAGTHNGKLQTNNAFAALNSLGDEDQDEDEEQNQHYYQDGAEGDTEDMYEDEDEDEEDEDEGYDAEQFYRVSKQMQGFEDEDDEPGQSYGAEMSRSASGAGASTAGASIEEAVVLSD